MRTSAQPKFEGLTILGRNGGAVPLSPDKAKLEAFKNVYATRNYRIRFDCPEFTSLCPVTGQPDFGHIVIDYVPNRLCLESKSLKLYLFAFRNCDIFHEEAVNRILNDVVKAIRPLAATVTGEFRPRGGIAIRVEASHPAPEDNTQRICPIFTWRKPEANRASPRQLRGRKRKKGVDRA